MEYLMVIAVLVGGGSIITYGLVTMIEKERHSGNVSGGIGHGNDNKRIITSGIRFVDGNQ